MLLIEADSVCELEPPSSNWLQRAATPPFDANAHDGLRSSCHALGVVRARQPDSLKNARLPLRIAAWNLERCKFVEETAACIARNGVDIALLTEADIGMARSGNRDTVADLATELATGHATAVEFVELGLGDDRKAAEFSDGSNRQGLHCNAILSRFRFDRSAIITLDDGGEWFAGKSGKGQRRVGGRIAVGIRICGSLPFWTFAVHFESEGGPDDRAEEAARLVAGVNRCCGEDAVVLGGDFNFDALPLSATTGSSFEPERFEPAFGILGMAGFKWNVCNSSGPTNRRHPWEVEFRMKKLDWLFVRDLTAKNPAIIPAVGQDGQNISDHEMILADIAAPQPEPQAASARD